MSQSNTPRLRRYLPFLTSSFVLVSVALFAEGCGNDEPPAHVFSGQGTTATDPVNVASGGSNNVNASGGSNQTGSGGSSSSSGGAPTVTVTCTDKVPENTNWEGATCYDWANNADPPACNEDWFLEGDYCAKTCGRCSGGDGDSTSGDGDSTSDGDGDSGTTGATGEGNPWGGVSGGQEAWASRYWDCCKQSCGWAANAGGNPVRSCGGDGANQVGPDDQSACNGGQSTTCNSFTPWAYSDDVSFGFVATHVGGASCGTCYHIEFTGQGQHNAGDPGSQAIAGKTMIVMATNIGGDVGGNQMDFLIPGGGTGAFYGCGSAWGVDQGTVESMGEKYGGLRSRCGGDSLDSIKSCVAGKCQELFGSRGLNDMYEGCMWYVDWLQAADNPKFRYESIECPQELRDQAY